MAGASRDGNTLDPRKVMTGHDGKLFITVEGVSYPLLNVDTFQSQMNFSNTDFQPIGDLLSYAIPVGLTVTLTFTEAVVTDEYVLAVILEALKKGVVPTFDFRGSLDRQYDSQEQQITYNTCVPDGTFDVQNLTPGEVIKRSTSFRVNSVPEAIKTLAGGL